MGDFKDLFKSADWKTEKHVPVIEVSDKLIKGEVFNITISVGKEIAHPNTTEHHISWIDAYFHPEEEKFPYQIGKFDFVAHGESVNGPNTSTIYAYPKITVGFKTGKPGKIYASSYCNIHGLWQNSKDLEFE